MSTVLDRPVRSVHRCASHTIGVLTRAPRLGRAQDDGTVIQVNEYLRQHFGYKHNHLGVAVGVLFAYIAIFGCALGIAQARSSHPHTIEGAPTGESRIHDVVLGKLAHGSRQIDAGIATPL